jgi:hypothetical protein
MRSFARIRVLLLGAAVCCGSGLGVLCTPVYASSPAPTYSAVTTVEGTHLPVGGEGTLVVKVSNVGDAFAEGGVSPIVIKDELPEGLEASAISSEQALCELTGLRCVYGGSIVPFELYTAVTVDISVKVKPGVSGALLNEVSVGGGGSKVIAVSKEAVVVRDGPVGNGIERAPFVATNEDGSQDTLAGSHPFQVTSTVIPDTVNTKDVRLELPDGLLGNTNVVPQCSTEAFEAIEHEQRDACPSSTALGVATAVLSTGTYTVPLFNLVPSPGEPARFGFEVQHIPVILDTSVRTGHGYGVTVNVHNVPQLEGFQESQVTVWGVPAEPVHNTLRGWGCQELYFYGESGVPCENPEDPEIAFLTMPTSCSGAEGLSVSATGDTWQDQSLSMEETRFTPVEGLTGCNELRFEPGVKVAPDGQAASTPTGLSVDITEPQQGAVNPTGVSGADEKTITVTLPEGFTTDPSGADGLEACTAAEIGYEKTNEAGLEEFTSGQPSCPDASKIATVKAKTPLLPHALEGAVYLASPQNYASGGLENPFGSLVALYLVAEDPVSGVLVKLPGRVSLNGATGQLTATFTNIPQVPVEETELHFFGSARAPLNTPAACGVYTTNTVITPWSGTTPVSPSSAFAITTGPDGTGSAGCAPTRAFNPGFNAETTSIQAAAFTPFTLTMTRPDQDQTLGGVELQMPPGLLGSLSKVALCAEPQASLGECGEGSLIGSTVVSAGLGGDPFTVTGGKIYMTVGYNGAPFGLSIVQPAKAGPFVLQEGRPVVVRASVFVNPVTAALRIVTGPVPKIIDGIPLQLQHVNATIERPGFVFNPTNCTATAINGSLTSSEGATAAVSSPFQVTNCGNLAFNPVLTASTSGKTSKAGGASLAVKLTYPAGPYDANIKEVKVDLPLQLPSRLTTLQKACTAAQFNANPAGCPAESIVGHAKATTPVIPEPLEGPAYFVSHGGEAFPSLIIVLQGYGITIDLTGTTQIKKGITSSTFSTIPDAPVGTFELTLPQGKYSALAANGNLCKTKLSMPTYYQGQNGTETHTTTPITTTSCPKLKPANKKHKAEKKTHSKTKKH